MREIALQDHMGGLLKLQKLVRDLSKRGLSRIFIAMMQLPQEGVKVHLQNNTEMAAFGLAQRVLNAKFSLILHYIEEEASRLKTEQNKPTNEETKNERGNNEDASASTGSTAPESDPGRSSVEENV